MRNIHWVQFALSFLLIAFISDTALADPTSSVLQQKIVLHSDIAAGMILYGDIDYLNFGYPEGFDPFCGRPIKGHPWPWNPNPSDAEGTDTIMVGSGALGACDGYSKNVDFKSSKPIPLKIRYSLKDLEINDVVLQMMLDDFEAPRMYGKFVAEINGKRAYFIEDAINNVLQTFAMTDLVSLKVPEAFISYFKSGDIDLFIDQKDGVGDGFSIDFARILINPKKYEHYSSIHGSVRDARNNPVCMADVIIDNGLVTVKTNSKGEYKVTDVPSGIAIVRVENRNGLINVSSVRLSTGVDVEYNPNLKGTPYTYYRDSKTDNIIVLSFSFTLVFLFGLLVGRLSGRSEKKKKPLCEQ